MRELLIKEGELTPDSSKSQIVYTFELDEPTDQLSILFTYGPKLLEDEDRAYQLLLEHLPKYWGADFHAYIGQDRDTQFARWKHYLPLQNLLTLSFDDAKRFRGAAHRHPERQELFLTQTSASPGLVPGELLPGTWTVTISVHAVVTELCCYQLCVWKGGHPLETNMDTDGAPHSYTA